MSTSSKQKSNLDIKSMAILTILCASWGLQQVAIKVAIQGISPVTQASIRSLGSFLLVLIWMRISKKQVFDKDGTLWWGIGAGLLFGVEFLLLYWGLLYTSASRAVIFLYISPFVVAFGSHLFVPGGYLRKIQFVGLGCAFLGILIAFQDSINLPTAQMLTGDLMVVGAAVAWGATTVLIKASPLIKIASSKTLLYQLATSAVILPIGAILMGESGVTSISPLIVFCLLYQVLWIASITYMIWFWLIQHYPVSNLSSFTFLTPLFGVIGGSVLLGEALTSPLIIALLLVGTGIYLVNKPKA